MKILLILSLLLIGASSFAEDLVLKPDIKFWLEGRFDYLSQTATSISQSTGLNTAQANEQDFQCNRLRPNAGGKVIDEISYRVRLNLCKTDAALNRDATPAIIDMAYFDNAVFDNFYLRIGKFATTEALGWETYYSSSNVFNYSAAFNTYNTTYGYFRTGAQAVYKIWDQTFKVDASTATPALTDTAAPPPSFTTNDGLAYEFIYKGTFLNDFVQPILSYSVFQTDGNPNLAAPTSSATSTLFAASVRVNPLMNLMVDLDYDYLDQPWNLATSFGNPSLTQTWELRAFYKFNKLVFNAQFWMDNFSSTCVGATCAAAGGASSSQFTDRDVEAGIWYYPYDNANYRYELQYSNVVQNNDPTNINSSVTTNKWFVGIRFDVGNPTKGTAKDVLLNGDNAI